MPNLPRKWFDARTVLSSGEWICSSCLHRTQQWTGRRRMSSVPVEDGDEDVKQRFLRKIISTYSPKKAVTVDAGTRSPGTSAQKLSGDTQEKGVIGLEKLVIQGDETVNKRLLRKAVPHYPLQEPAAVG